MRNELQSNQPEKEKRNGAQRPRVRRKGNEEWAYLARGWETTTGCND